MEYLVKFMQEIPSGKQLENKKRKKRKKTYDIVVEKCRLHVRLY